MTTIPQPNGLCDTPWQRTWGQTDWWQSGISCSFGFNNGSPQRTIPAGESFLEYATINFDSDFTLKLTYWVVYANSDCALRVYIDNDLIFSTPTSSLGTFSDVNVGSISGYRGNHVLKFGIYALNNHNTDAGIGLTSAWVEDEVSNKYVDITTGDDADTGETWVLAYQTVKKGLDEIPDASYSILHIAEGDYSAQAAIDLDKNVSILCEDYGGGNANPPLTVILPATV